MIEIESWLETFLQALDATFPARVWFAGLQGSYARGEATDSSDIDMVVILDELSPKDITAYHAMLDELPHRDLLCGFLSGKSEITNWEPADLFQFFYDTIPIRGSLDSLLPLLGETSIRRAIKTSACNVYHGCVHNMLYDKSDEILKGLYKSASFTVQTICFLQTGKYVRHLQALREMVAPEERTIVDVFRHLKSGEPIHFVEMSSALFTWAQKWITSDY